jgi:hydrogenase small subunit
MATRSHVEDVHIVWITDGLGCDGDTVSITAATQPDIEDVVPGVIPALPRVHLRNPVLAFEPGSNSFMMWWYKAERGELDPSVLVVEGSAWRHKGRERGNSSRTSTYSDSLEGGRK